ncbi:hypothetical protein C8T65DRAFT_830503 [Cerioporus squamosus]|nr:hypothetical protein C8T65DRAFT_830503 [Cerioporus squamosus]
MAGAAQGVDASRVVFAFARDNALPGSRWWKRIHPYTDTPAAGARGMACDVLVGRVRDARFLARCADVARRASVVGLYISYITPIFLRLTFWRKKFKPGPFSLGRWQLPIGIIAVAWVGFVTVLFVVPPGIHPRVETMNYSVVVIMAVFVFATLSWIFSARKWSTGPIWTTKDSHPAKYEVIDLDTGRVRRSEGARIRLGVHPGSQERREREERRMERERKRESVE